MTSTLVESIGSALKERGWKLASAESCTGGGLAYAITSVPGSSAWFDCGLITYSNTAKLKLLHVNPCTLANFGAVSEQTAREMAEGALKSSNADISIATTGIAGPAGGTEDKPIGTLWIAIASAHKSTQASLEKLSGERQSIREQSIQIALDKLLVFIRN